MSYTDALQELRGLGAERALVLEGQPDGLQIRAAYGFQPDVSLATAPLSLSLLQKVATRAEPLLIADVSANVEFKDSLSLLLSGAQSLLCVPWFAASGAVEGLLYGDIRLSRAAFSRRQLDGATQIARQLEKRLGGATTRPTPVAPPPIQERAPGLPTQRHRLLPTSAPVAAPKPAAQGPVRRLSGNSRTIFFRSLATLVGAGIRIDRSLLLLSERGNDPRSVGASAELAQRVSQGQSLSAAMTPLGVFSPFEIHMVRLGENSGKLVDTLRLVADHEENAQKQTMRLRGVLLYPAILLAGSLGFLLIAPPLVLRNNLELLARTGGEAPWITKAVYALSTALVSPPMLVLAVLLAALAVRFVPRLLARGEGLASVHRALWRVPLVGTALRSAGVAGMARSLAIQLRAGVPLLSAVDLAAAGHPVFAEFRGQLKESLQDGASLADTLQRTEIFPRMLVEMVRVGETVGALDAMVGWTADCADEEVDLAIERFTAAIEPLSMLVIGGVVGMMVLATMLPMVGVLESL